MQEVVQAIIGITQDNGSFFIYEICSLASKALRVTLALLNVVRTNSGPRYEAEKHPPLTKVRKRSNFSHQELCSQTF